MKKYGILSLCSRQAVFIQLSGSLQAVVRETSRIVKNLKDLSFLAQPIGLNDFLVFFFCIMTSRKIFVFVINSTVQTVCMQVVDNYFVQLV